MVKRTALLMMLIACSFEPAETVSALEGLPVTVADCYEEGDRFEWYVDACEAPEGSHVVIEHDGLAWYGYVREVIWGPPCTASVSVTVVEP